MTRERWLIFTFVPALLLLNAFVVLNYTGLSYEPFSWKAFAQMYPDGASCTANGQCSNMFCVDQVCCDSICDLPDQVCDLPGREGECLTLQTAPAPALSGTGLLAAAGLLAAIGAFGVLRRRRNDS